MGLPAGAEVTSHEKLPRWVSYQVAPRITVKTQLASRCSLRLREFNDRLHTGALTLFLFLSRWMRPPPLEKASSAWLVSWSNCSLRGPRFPRVCSTGTRFLAELRKRPWPLPRPKGDGNGGRFARSPCLRLVVRSAPLPQDIRHCAV